MAKVIGPLHSTEARGRIDDLVYGTWRGIRFVRKFTPPTFGTPDPRDPQKLLVAAANAAWKLLSNAQRNGWHDYAQRHPRIDWTGVPVRISGYNAFVSCHVTCSRAGGTPLVEAPSTTLPFPLSSFVSSQVDNNIRLSWSGPTQPEAHVYKVHLFRSGPWSLGKVPDYHRAAIIAIEGIATSPFDDPLTINGRYGYWARVVDVTTGETSPFLRTQTDFVWSEPIPQTGSLSGYLKEEDEETGIPYIDVYATPGEYVGGSNLDGYFYILDMVPGSYRVTPSTPPDWTPTYKDIEVVAGENTDVGMFVGTF